MALVLVDAAILIGITTYLVLEHRAMEIRCAEGRDGALAVNLGLHHLVLMLGAGLVLAQLLQEVWA